MSDNKARDELTIFYIQTTAKVWHQFLTESVAEGKGQDDAVFFIEWLQKKLAALTDNQERRK